MAHLHNFAHFHKRHQSSWTSDLGNKVKHVAEFAGTVKGLYDVGKLIYHGAQALGPIVSSVAMAI